MEAVGGAIIGAIVAFWFVVLAWRIDTQGDGLYRRLDHRLDEIQTQLRQVSSQWSVSSARLAPCETRRSSTKARRESDLGSPEIHVGGEWYSRIAMVAVAWSALALLTAAIFWLSTRIDGLGARIDALGTSLSSRIDGQGASLNARIDSLTTEFSQLSRRLEEHLGRHAS